MSSATVKPEMIIAACNNYLAARKARIAMEREEMIAAEMQKRRWFRKNLSREQAIARLRIQGGFIRDWDAPYHRGLHWFNKMQELAELALIAVRAGGTVTISDDLADSVHEYMPEVSQ